MDSTTVSVITDTLSGYATNVPVIAGAGLAVGALTFGIRFLWRFGKSLIGR